MKHRIAKHLLALYPPGWRTRYEDEFSALLEDANLSWLDLFDILMSAADANQQHMPARMHKWLVDDGLLILAGLLIALGLLLMALSTMIVPPPTPENLTTVTGTLRAISPSGCCATEADDLVIHLYEFNRPFYINRAGHYHEAVRSMVQTGETITLTVFEDYLNARGSVPTVGIETQTASFRPEWFTGNTFVDHRMNTRVQGLLMIVLALGVTFVRWVIRRNVSPRHYAMG